MKIGSEKKLKFDDVLIVPKRSSLDSRKDVILEREYTFRNSGKSWHGIPVIAANMDSTGTFAMAKSLSNHKALTAIHKHYDKKELQDFFLHNPGLAKSAFYTIGINDKDYEKLQWVKNHLPEWGNFPTMLCIDVANGYTTKFIDFVKKMREELPETIIMAGNVVTPNMTEELVLSGADIIKIGLGSGNACITRQKTGVGYPQLSAIAECADAAHGIDGHICSDGGIRTAGDLCKAFAANADFVMIGSMFAGTDECDGYWDWDVEFEKFFIYHGMASSNAMERYDSNGEYKTAEGKEIRVDYKGPVDNVMKDLLGGLRSCCSYTGAKKLKYLAKCASFIRVN